MLARATISAWVCGTCFRAFLKFLSVAAKRIVSSFDGTLNSRIGPFAPGPGCELVRGFTQVSPNRSKPIVFALIDGRHLAMPNATNTSRLGSNPLHPDRLSPSERRAELCGLLALGLLRLRMRNSSELSAETGEFPLHNSGLSSGSATPNDRRTT